MPSRGNGNGAAQETVPGTIPDRSAGMRGSSQQTARLGRGSDCPWHHFCSRPRLATTPLPFSLPSALRTPGRRTCTYEVMCHARHTRCVERPLHDRVSEKPSLSSAVRSDT